MRYGVPGPPGRQSGRVFPGIQPFSPARAAFRPKGKNIQFVLFIFILTYITTGKDDKSEQMRFADDREAHFFTGILAKAQCFFRIAPADRVTVPWDGYARASLKIRLLRERARAARKKRSGKVPFPVHAQGGTDDRGEPFRHAVAAQAAQGVVDPLEYVNIQQQRGKGGSSPSARSIFSGRAVPRWVRL